MSLIQCLGLVKKAVKCIERVQGSLGVAVKKKKKCLVDLNASNYSEMLIVE